MHPVKTVPQQHSVSVIDKHFVKHLRFLDILQQNSRFLKDIRVF